MNSLNSIRVNVDNIIQFYKNVPSYRPDALARNVSLVALGLFLGMQSLCKNLTHHATFGTYFTDSGTEDFNASRRAFTAAGSLTTASVTVLAAATIGIFGTYGAIAVTITAIACTVFTSRQAQNTQNAPTTAPKEDHAAHNTPDSTNTALQEDHAIYIPGLLSKLSLEVLQGEPPDTINYISTTLGNDIRSKLGEWKKSNLGAETCEFITLYRDACATYAATVAIRAMQAKEEYLHGEYPESPFAVYYSSTSKGQNLTEEPKQEFDRAKLFNVIFSQGATYDLDSLLDMFRKNRTKRRYATLSALMFSPELEKLLFPPNETAPENTHYHRDNTYNLLTQASFGHCVVLNAFADDPLCNNLGIHCIQNETPMNYEIDMTSNMTMLTMKKGIDVVYINESDHDNTAPLFNGDITISWGVSSAILSARPIDKDMDADFIRKHIKVDLHNLDVYWG